MPDLVCLKSVVESMRGENVSITETEGEILVLEECIVTYKENLIMITGSNEEGDIQEFKLDMNVVEDFEISNDFETRVDLFTGSGEIIIETW